MSDNLALRALRFEFEATADALAHELCVINEYLASGAPPVVPSAVARALVMAPDEMNKCRHLLAQIERITDRTEHPNRGKP